MVYPYRCNGDDYICHGLDTCMSLDMEGVCIMEWWHNGVLIHRPLEVFEWEAMWRDQACKRDKLWDI